NATVSACSPLGHPVGACGFSVTTPSTGSFLLAVPAGQYILKANDTGYNTSYLPIGLVAGEVLPVGILFLKQFGTALGTVISSSTFLPVANAAVFACASWSGGGCTPQVTTDSLGRFTISAAPGPYTLSVLAGGYADSYSGATLRAGATSTLAPILLNPLGVDIAYPVAGQVISAVDPTQGIAAANVAVLLNGTPVASAQTSSNGVFSMSVLYGTYTLKVSAAGYAPAAQAITVHGVVSGLIIPLAVMTFQTAGTVTDGLTGQVLAGVAIEENGIILAVTDVNGQYTLALENGTHSLTATYAGGGTVEYGLVAFAITVNGANQVHDLQLLPPTVAIHGIVADIFAGTPLAGASISVRGTTVDGVPVSQTLVADPGGGFVVTLPLGSYNASATYTGYTPATKDFPVTSAGGLVSILLSPTSGHGGSSVAPSGNAALFVLIGALAVIVGAVVALGLLVAGRTRKSRRPPAPPRSPPSGRGVA
ncbi:MAG TPA: carboxypeptidase regulatory-like domain-containing protein, partial [Thermoplasmata archaeon]